MNIDRLDHLVLTVQNIERTCAFYERALGMQTVTFGAGRKALQFGQQKINLHEAGKEYDPKARRPTPGSGDLCFIASDPLAEVIEHLRACGVAIEEGAAGVPIANRRSAIADHHLISSIWVAVSKSHAFPSSVSICTSRTTLGW